jgi:phospholipase/carboxylesterase
LVSVPGALAFVLDKESAGGPPGAFQAEREFARLRPQEDGSLQMALPQELADEAFEKGWGEPNPYSGTPFIYGPRGEHELEVVWRLLQASYEFVRG